MDVAVKSGPTAKPGTQKAEVAPAAIKSVGIIGAGQMGTGIAHVVALAGYKVALKYDIRLDSYFKESVICTGSRRRKFTVYRFLVVPHVNAYVVFPSSAILA